jgi:hypothetical protein
MINPPGKTSKLVKEAVIMEVQCECGKFRAKINGFPNRTPGRLVCYCDDCQKYLRHLKRVDLLDSNGGTEVIPVYPADVEIVDGRDHLRCVRLSPTGTFRFYTSCCNTPIANTRPGKPWVGFLRCVYTNGRDTQNFDQLLGPVRSRIMGLYAQGNPPVGTPNKFDLKALLSVMPFMLKGKLFGKVKPSPFFAADADAPVVIAHVLSEAERQTSG